MQNITNHKGFMTLYQADVSQRITTTTLTGRLKWRELTQTQQFTSKAEYTGGLKMNQQKSTLADCVLTFQFLWSIYCTKAVGGTLSGIVFTFDDVCSAAGLLIASNWLSEENMLTFAMCSQSRASL